MTKNKKKLTIEDYRENLQPLMRGSKLARELIFKRLDSSGGSPKEDILSLAIESASILGEGYLYQRAYFSGGRGFNGWGMIKAYLKKPTIEWKTGFVCGEDNRHILIAQQKHGLPFTHDELLRELSNFPKLNLSLIHNKTYWGEDLVSSEGYKMNVRNELYSIKLNEGK